MKRREYLVSAGALTSSIAIAGCSGDDDDDPSPEATDSDEQDEDQDSSEQQATEDEANPAEFVLRDIDGPETAELDETFSLTLTVENIGGQEGDWTGEDEAGWEIQNTELPSPDPDRWAGDWFLRREITIPPGEVVEVERALEASRPQFIYYRISGSDSYGVVEVPSTRAPILTDVALVSDWSSFGDIEDNRIEQATIGDFADIAYRKWQFVHDGTLEGLDQIEIYDEDNDRVHFDTYESEQITESGWRQWERPFAFPTADLPSGEYTAIITSRDNIADAVSDSFSYDFQLES